MNTAFLEQVFAEYQKSYAEIFKHIYPAKNSTGFPERNLSVNFSKAFERISNRDKNNSVTWFEFQFGEKNNLHYDAIIINHAEKEIYVIEAKRFSEVEKKLNQVGDDISRINNIYDDNTLAERIFGFEEYQIYGVILSDVWEETETKKDISRSFMEHTFIEKYAQKLGIDSSLAELYYDFRDFEGTVTLEKYKLTSIVWKI